MDTLSDRWAKLEPFTTIVGPDDDRPRPTAILFHGCGGLRGHLPMYAEAAKAAGWRAAIVDSYAPRGWSREFAMATVCTGLMLRGWERAAMSWPRSGAFPPGRTWMRPASHWPAGATAAGASWRP